MMRLAIMRFGMMRFASGLLLLLACATPLAAQSESKGRPALGDTVTTKSGLRYVFVKHGTGPKPQTGDIIMVHGIGYYENGKEFWNTRTQGAPIEYRVGVDRVIRGFEEGIRQTRGGDRLVMVMKPELAYGKKGNSDIPPNSTLIFDYEVLSVRSR